MVQAKVGIFRGDFGGRCAIGAPPPIDFERSKAMTENIKDRFFNNKRWYPGNECLNMDNVNLPPLNYYDDKEKWINELTTFIFLYPKEWEEILKEYTLMHTWRNDRAYNTQLEYYRDDEGYLRKEGETDIFLRIYINEYKGGGVLEEIASYFLSKGLGFQKYEEYCQCDRADREKHLRQMKRDILQSGVLKHKQIVISYESDYDGSSFQREDLYIDQLNYSYTIL